MLKTREAQLLHQLKKKLGNFNKDVKINLAKY